MQARHDHKPLWTAGDIYQALAGLVEGDIIPASVYIHDYANGGIPEWTIRERQESGILTILTLIDPATPHKNRPELAPGVTGYAALELFLAPERVLTGPVYLYYPGCVRARTKLSDARQEARRIAERLSGVAQGSYEPRPGYGYRKVTLEQSSL